MNKACLIAVALCVLTSTPPSARERATGTGGTIRGRVRLTGEDPGNVVIRMGVDPMCAALYRGKQPVDEAVVTSDDGGLANAFIKVDGTFPPTPVPTQPVVLDQRGCFYVPRVMGARVGQILRVRNSDNVLHNVHSMTAKSNIFNVGQPQAGLQYDFRLRDEEILRIKCDVHRWMTAFVGVASHPYFATSRAGGWFEISNVPPGSYTVESWHERYGTTSRTVRVRAGIVSAVDFAYSDTKNGRAPRK